MIINSLLDTDVYKFTMMQVVFHHFPDAEVEYEFISRTPGVNFRPYVDTILREVKNLCSVALTTDELKYLQHLGLFSEDFLDWLKDFTLDMNHLIIEDDPFSLKIKGPWLNTILFEVPILAIISELFHKPMLDDSTMRIGEKHLYDKIHYLRSQTDIADYVKFVDFGTRRRYSKSWHKFVIDVLHQELPKNFAGTSNVWLAKEFDLKPVGTMAHEYLQACQQLAPNLEDSERFGFYKWIEEYGDKLAIALSDVYNRYVFVNDLDEYLCQKFQGFRQDSGDPFSWGDLVVERLKQQQVDPNQKSLVFSDSLNFEKMVQLTRYFYQRIQPMFGIGTYLTNDVGIEPVDIIIKMISCNQAPVGKLTDDPSKTVCPDQAYLNRLKNTFGYDEDRRMR